MDLEASVAKRLQTLHGTFAKHGPEGRAALASLLTEPLHLRAVETEQGQRFEVSGRYALGPLLLAESVTSSGGVPNGFSPLDVPGLNGEFRLVA